MMFSVRKDFMVMTILSSPYCFATPQGKICIFVPSRLTKFFCLCLQIIGQFKNRLHLRGINDQNLLKTEETYRVADW